ncbi:MAG: DUF4266 domain-containing protein [Planctomycetota bacterium]
MPATRYAISFDVVLRRARCAVGFLSLPCLLLLLLSCGNGCRNVEFYERELLVDPILALDDDPTEIHFLQKCLYSREGSAGGIGSSAGGGCGCY